MDTDLNLNLTPGLGTTHFGIVLLFGPSLNHNAVLGSQFYKEFSEDPEWELGQTIRGEMRHIPHLSLLHLSATPSALLKCLGYLRDIAHRTRCFNGSFSSTRVFGDGWLFWLTPRTPELNSLHEKVLETCAPLRHGNVSEITPDMSDVQQSMVIKYGFTNTGYCWNPHITLCKLHPDKMHHVTPTEDLIEACFARIALVEIGRFGATERIVQEYYFQGA